MKKKSPAPKKNKSSKQPLKTIAKSSAKSSGKKASKSSDIIDYILEDHKPLKALIKIMKDDDKYDIDERREAFEKFAPLLVAHAKPEEQVLYTAMKAEDDLRTEAFEGDVEHGLADQMLEEIKRTKNDEDLWSARVKVLAEIVEHHIEEEEDEMLPDYRKQSEREERIALGEKFMQLKLEIQAEGSNDAPPEREIADDDSDEEPDENDDSQMHTIR